MILNLPIVLLLTGGLLFIVFAFVEYAILKEPECKHEKFATFDSYHKKVCIECGFEVSTIGVKK